jgi:hypothetical protein
MIWQELIACLHRLGAVELEEADGCGVRLLVDGQPRKIAVKLARHEPSVIVVAPVCRLHHFEPRRALEYNGAVEHWTLALEDTLYVLRRTLPLPSLSEAQLDAALRVAVVEVARLQRQRVAPAAVAPSFGPLFAHWT